MLYSIAIWQISSQHRQPPTQNDHRLLEVKKISTKTIPMKLDHSDDLTLKQIIFDCLLLVESFERETSSPN